MSFRQFYRIPTTSQTYADGSALAEIGGWHLILAETEPEETEYSWGVTLLNRDHELNVQTLHHERREAKASYDSLLATLGSTLPCPICDSWYDCPCPDSEAESIDTRVKAVLRHWVRPVENLEEVPY